MVRPDGVMVGWWNGVMAQRCGGAVVQVMSFATFEECIYNRKDIVRGGLTRSSVGQDNG